jgi:hypothetical protein
MARRGATTIDERTLTKRRLKMKASAEELLDKLRSHLENEEEEQAVEEYEELITFYFDELVRLLPDEDLLKCVHDDRIMLPGPWLSKEDWKELVDSFDKSKRKEHASLSTKTESIEKELNRRGIKWRQYSDEERDCLWLLQHLMDSSTVVTPEIVQEFRRLVKANGGRVPWLKFLASTKGKVDAWVKPRLEAVGLIADWTDEEGRTWVQIRGLKEAA